jgi:sec-independent protein translocase protein TatA
MGSIGMPEIILIFLVVLLLFGAKRLPELARGLGKGIREFKKAASDIQDELDMSEVERDLKKNFNDLNNVQRLKKQNAPENKKGE